jgi:hypothetical protein
VSVPWPKGDPSALARTIVAERRFRDAIPAPAREATWWDRLRSWLGRLWDAFINALPSHGNRVVTLIGVIIAVLALIAFVVAIVVLLERHGPRRRAARVRNAAARALDDQLDAVTLRTRAQAAAAAGRWRDAAVLLWTSALRALDERGRVRYDAARTPGEWRRAVRDPAFDTLAREAVLALFGDRATDAGSLARMEAAYEVLLAA